jgi:hypothetical protein
MYYYCSTKIRSINNLINQNGYRLLIGNQDDCIFTLNEEVISLIENKNNIKFEIIK